MKTLTTLFLLLISTVCMSQIAHTDTADVYLQRMPLINYTHIARINGHKILEFTGSCGVLSSPGIGLILQCNPLTGVRLADDSNDLHIPGYYEFALENVCTGIDVCPSAYKEDFYLTPDGNNFPYILSNQLGLGGSRIVNLVDSGMWGYDRSEWDTLLRYGAPDTMLAYNPDTISNNYFDPHESCRTGVLKGYSDTYNGNSFNIDSVADGIYYGHVSINLPADVFDPGKYPNDYRHLCKITGDTFEWTDQMPACCTYTSAPNAPRNVRIQSHTLTWDTQSSATEYDIYAALAYHAQGGWTIGNHTPTLIATTTTNSLLLPNTAGMFIYFVSSKNCAGESQKTETRKVNQ